MTPRISQHARERCAEMGISTKIAKQIIRRPDLIRPSRSVGGSEKGLVMVTSDRYPEYAVVYCPADEVVVTVLFRTCERYRRDGAHFIPVDA